MASVVIKTLVSFIPIISVFFTTTHARNLHNFSISYSSTDHFNRYSFPNDFIFGTASSSYQYEGAVREGGRGYSIWDKFTHKFPGRNNMANGDVAVDFYHRYKDDIKLMKKLNMDSFRFSISWARILPKGKLSDGVNEEGLQFYKNLIDELIANDIEPLVTIFHWDLPQPLVDEYGGFLSPRIVDDYRDFASLCFKEFGDKVKLWTTFNEPLVFSVAGYDTGKKALGRCSKWVNPACEAGDSGVEPYLVTHHILLSHAAGVQEFRRCAKCRENSQIGIVLSPIWFEPHTNSSADKEAVKRALDFNLGWHLNPITFGDYPQTMRTIVGDRLPSFTHEESESIKNSVDFVGINYYTALYAANLPSVDPKKPSFTTDQHVVWLKERNGVPIGNQAATDMLLVYPKGIRLLMNYVKDNYKNPVIYITENGYDDYSNDSLPVAEALNDIERLDYHKTHLQELLKAINDGVNVKGYFAWSLLDNFEWDLGYTVRYGLYYVDYKDNLKRYAKESANWFSKFLERRNTNSIKQALSILSRIIREDWYLLLQSGYRMVHGIH